MKIGLVTISEQKEDGFYSATYCGDFPFDIFVADSGLTIRPSGGCIIGVQGMIALCKYLERVEPVIRAFHKTGELAKNFTYPTELIPKTWEES